MRRMSWVEDHYYKMNRTMLKAIGVWPYHRTKWTPVVVVLVSSLFLSFVLVQLAVFVTHEVTVELTVTLLSLAIPSMIMLFFYCIYYFNADSFKEIMQHMYSHWDSLSDTMEFAIMVDHANLSKKFTLLFIGFGFVIDIVAVLSHAIPITLDIVAPINVTRGENVHIMSEYFLNHSKYYLVVVVHLTICVCVGVTAVITISVTLLSYAHHACALFKVANYRMTIVMDDTVLQISSPEREYVIYERIIHAVTFHRTAIEFSNLIIDQLEKSLTVLLVIGVVSTSMNLFRLLNAITYHRDDLVELFTAAACVIVHYSYLFFGNHIGQQVTDNNSDIFDTVYNLPWYVASRNTKQLLLFVLQRGNKKFYLSISSLFNASYEGFTTLTTSSISYFTVLYSV